MKFFPLVFALFTIILFANVIGLIPYTFTVTSHIIITSALAALVFIVVLAYSFWSICLMPSLKDMRVRITATKATQKITKAMQMVAVSKLRCATAAAEASRAYTRGLSL